MIALSIRQPWAWMIVHGWKDIENRQWSTRFRGRFLVHASKGMTAEEYREALYVARSIRRDIEEMPSFTEIERGGIIGSVELVDCVRQSESRWFYGPWGFVLAAPTASPFLPCRGQLGFFEAPIF